MTMIRRVYTLRFDTPAFLGNAEQNGQWRTPPFKAQLRQWWRVAYADNRGFSQNVATMRETEGKLFGHAWLENDRDAQGGKISARKSEIRIRLGQWSMGELGKEKWTSLPGVKHPEVKVLAAADVYLGYGPVTTGGLKANAAIQAGESTTLSLAYPDEHAPLIEQAFYLMQRFGTVGGRSRNGWGSYDLQAHGEDVLTGTLPLRNWQDCLKLDWPHAIGKDEQDALIWQTKPAADWKGLMRELAVLKIALRTRFKFPNEKPDGEVHARHWLSYPITRHSVRAWGNNARLPNSLRFKICPTPEGQLIGVIFHMPCLPPKSFNPDPVAIACVWQQVHGFLDTQTTLTRTKA